MKILLYIILVMMFCSPVFATSLPPTKKGKIVKLVKPKNKKTQIPKHNSIEKRPVPKVSIKNPQAIYDN